jgi:hypothetical protein
MEDNLRFFTDLSIKALGFPPGLKVTGFYLYAQVSVAYLLLKTSKCYHLRRLFYYFTWSRDRSVGIATSYGLDVRGSVPSRWKILFVCFTAFRPTLGATQPRKWVPWGLSVGVMRQGREADHSLPSGAKIQEWWRYTSIPHTSSWYA